MKIFPISVPRSAGKRRNVSELSRKNISRVKDKFTSLKTSFLRDRQMWFVSDVLHETSKKSSTRNCATYSGTEEWNVIVGQGDAQCTSVVPRLVTDENHIQVSDDNMHSETESLTEKCVPKNVCAVTVDEVDSCDVVGDNECRSSGTLIESVGNHLRSTEFHHVSGKCYFLILRYPSRLHFRGVISVTPIIGSTSFLGYAFPCNAKSYLLFSPKGTSPLYLQSLGLVNKEGFESIPKIPGIGSNILDRMGSRDSAILIEPACGEQWEKLIGSFSRTLCFNPLVPPIKEKKLTPSEVDVEANLRVEFVQPGDSVGYSRFHDENSEWDQLSELILKVDREKGPMRLMVFGGKGVGKSTFMRYMVNRWLSKYHTRAHGECPNSQGNTILYVDFDPGQSEFIPPGCVSATLVTEPLLGPNYTHFKDPERMFCIGDLNVEKCPDWYLKCAEELLKFCQSNPALHDIPWFINTMGFCRGIGADLAVKLIQLCHPTHVIQITSRFSRRNFDPIDLLLWQSVKSWKGKDWNPSISSMKGAQVPEYFYRHLWSLTERTVAEEVVSARAENGFRYTTFQDSEEIEDIDSEWGLPAWQCRDLCILAYFSRMVSGPKFSVLQPTPHKIKLSTLTLSIPSPLLKPQMITTAFNARLVALCNSHSSPVETLQEIDISLTGTSEVNDEAVTQSEKIPWERILKPNTSSHPRVLFNMPLAPCLGFGIVRAIDNVSHNLFLTTPVKKDVLTSVNCLATSPSFGSLPKELYLEPLKGNLKRRGSIPYILTCDKNNSLCRPVPRVFNVPTKILSANKT